MATAYGIAITSALGQVIKELRGQQGLSQEALAERASLHRTYIGLVERGQRGLTVAAAAALGQALGLTLSDLITKAEGQIELE